MKLINTQGGKNSKNKYPILKHIIPFSFEMDNHISDEKSSDYDGLIKSLIDTDNWQVVSRPKSGSSELYEHLLNLLDYKGNGTPEECTYIPLCKEGQDEAIIGTHLVKSLPNVNVSFKNKVGNALVKIDEYQLYIFKTNIAFLILNFNIEGVEDLKELIELNSKLKSLSHHVGENVVRVNYLQDKSIELQAGDLHKIGSECVNHFEIKVDNRHGESFFLSREYQTETQKNLRLIYNIKKDIYLLRWNEAIEFDYVEYIQKILEQFACMSFFNNFTTKGQVAPAKAIVFTAEGVEVEEGVQSLEYTKNLLRIAKGYSTKYKVNCNDNRNPNLNQEIYAPFDDVIWSFSREGISNMVLQKPQEEGGFLRSDFADRINQSYLFLYILALHQYFGLLSYAQKISRLPNRLADFTDVTKEKSKQNYDQLNKLREEVSFFYLKCVFEEVSHITHQAIFYKGIIDVLGIKSMLQEIDYEMHKVHEIAGLIRNSEMKKFEEAKKKRGDIFTIAGAIVAFIALVDKFWGFVDKFGVMKLLGISITNNEYMDKVIIVVLLMGTVFLIGALGYWYRIRKLKTSNI